MLSNADKTFFTTFFFLNWLLLQQWQWMSFSFQISLWSVYFSSQLNLPHCSHLLIHEKKLTGYGIHEILKLVKNAVYRRLASWMTQVLALNPSMVKNASKMTSFLVWNMLLSNSWPHAKLWHIFTLSCKALHTGLSGANGALWRVKMGKFLPRWVFKKHLCAIWIHLILACWEIYTMFRYWIVSQLSVFIVRQLKNKETCIVETLNLGYFLSPIQVVEVLGVCFEKKKKEREKKGA